MNSTEKINQWLNELEQFASRGELIISKSQDEHFSNIVQIMNMVGAERKGSKNVTGSNGVVYLVDIYILPSGSQVLAGYENLHV